MAVTSRNLHQPIPRRVVGVAPWKPKLALVQPYLRVGLAIVCAYALVAVATGRGQVWLDDLRYGRPRTQQVAGMVGHNESSGEPTRFLAMNLNRRVAVLEFPGGDATKAQVLQGPYLFGANEDLTPVNLRLQDIDGDGKKDLIVSVKREEIVYINTGDNFRLINAVERQRLQRAP